VLVCHGERHVSRLIQVNLERQGRTVVCAYDGEESIKLLESAETTAFHRVVLDAMLPKRGGYKVLKWIRTHAATEHLWVAVMIPSAQERELWDQRPYRANLYIPKPFNPNVPLG